MEINHILVAGSYEKEFKKKLPLDLKQSFRFKPVDEITDADLSWADAYVGSQPAPGFHFSRIKWVHSFNAGINNFLEIEGWREHNVLLTRTVCSFGQRISEYCLSYVLKELQYHRDFAAQQLAKKWVRQTPKMVKDQTIVIFGTGEIGQEVARTFQFFGAKVYGVSLSGRQKEYFQKAMTVSDVNTVISEADWVISTLPLTKETERLFNQALFSYFNGAAFINIGRGAVVEEQALIDALDVGSVRHAVLDVFAIEPLPEESELWEREDITITPHISAVTELDEAIDCFIDTFRKVQNGEQLVNQVDFSKGY